MPDLDQIIDDAISNPVLSEAADEVGKNLLDAMIGELTLIPHPTMPKQNVWATRKQADQDATIGRFKSRIRQEVLRFFRHVMASGNPATVAKLEKVVLTDKGIQGILAIDRHISELHALADFAGERVVVIMPDDLEQYFESMGEVVSIDDQASLDLGENKPIDGADQSDAPADQGPDESDRELAVALRLHAVWVTPDVVEKWDAPQLEAAWKWVQEMESQTGSPAMPSFLDEYVGTAEGPVDDASDGGDESPATDAVPAGTESEPGPAETQSAADERKKDKRTLKALVEECLHLAAEIGEGDITKNQFKKKGRDGLFDYLTYATEKKQRDANADASATNSKTEIASLVKMLDGLTIYVEVPVVASWSEEQRDEVTNYARRLSSGKLPDHIPEILTPYMGGEEDTATA